MELPFNTIALGRFAAGANGNNLKDRSAGFIARYNWIEGGNRNFDLVDAEDSSVIRNSPEYHKTFVYGNILIKQNGGNNQITHYGGDSGDEPNYRKGKLYFYNNTIYSERTGNSVVFRLSTNDEQCDRAKQYSLHDGGRNEPCDAFRIWNAQPRKQLVEKRLAKFF